MTRLPYSPYWREITLGAFALLLVDVAVITLKTRQSVADQPSVEEVFSKDKPQFSADLGQLSAVVPPTDYEAPLPEAHGPQYRTGDWLKAQGSMAWTLEVMSSADEEEVKAFLQKRSDRDKYVYFAYKEGETLRYIVVYDVFPTRELALGVAASSDFGMADGARPAPMKFVTYLPNVPVLQPAIDQPPTPSYGDVPIVEAPTETAPDAPATEPGATGAVEPAPPPSATGTPPSSTTNNGNEDAALFR